MSIPVLTIVLVRNIFQIFLFPPQCNVEPVISSASKQTQRPVVSTSEPFIFLKTVSLIVEIFKTGSASQELAAEHLLSNDSWCRMKVKIPVFPSIHMHHVTLQSHPCCTRTLIWVWSESLCFIVPYAAGQYYHCTDSDYYVQKKQYSNGALILDSPE